MIRFICVGFFATVVFAQFPVCGPMVPGLGVCTDPGNPACCPAVLAFNGAGCMCDAAVTAMVGEMLPSLKILVGVCSGGQVGVIESGGSQCPAPTFDLQCQYPAALVASLGLGGVGDDPESLVPVSDSTIYSLRLRSIMTFLAMYDGITDTSIPLEARAVTLRAALNSVLSQEPETAYHSIGFGTYTGLESILEYIYIVAPEVAAKLGISVQAATTEQFSSFTVDGDLISTEAGGTTCFGTYVEGQGVDCIHEVEALVEYEFNFAPCSDKLAEVTSVWPESLARDYLHCSGSVYQLCDVVMTSCTGEYQQYQSASECVQYLQSRPRFACAKSLAKGPSTSCVWIHAMLASLDPKHCFHVGQEVADLDGNFKCHPDQCAEEGFSPEFQALLGQKKNPCSVHADCYSGYFCSPNRRVCVPRKDEGAYCNVIQLCLEGSECQQSMCVASS